MENKIKHLEMIQNVIDRMSKNSFMLKGWAITLILAILAIVDEDTNELYFVIFFVSVSMFWILDSYYLCQERRYCELFNDVRKKDNNNIDFFMDANNKFVIKSNSKFCCKLKFIRENFKYYFIASLFSKTEFFFYFPLMAISALIVYLTIIK